MSPRPRLLIALALSVAVNLFVIGAAVGVWFGQSEAARRASALRKPQPTLWATAETLRPEDREAFRQVLRTRARTLVPEVRATRAARRLASDRIAAPTYDAAAARAALADVRAAESRMRGEVDATLLDFIARLPPQGRASIADAVVRGRIGPALRPGDGGGRQGPPLPPGGPATSDAAAGTN